MKHFFTILLLTAVVNSFSQITITPTADNTPAESQSPVPYDSSFNFIREKSYLLIGQQIYFLPLSGKYIGNDAPVCSSNFVVGDPTSAGSDLRAYRGQYLGGNSYMTPLNKIRGRYFLITDFVANPSSLEYIRSIYMELLSVEDKGDMLYCKLNDMEEYQYLGITNFIVVGFYEKLKKNYINQSFYLNAPLQMSIKDVITGQLVTLTDTNEKWQCYDVTLLETSILPSPILSVLLKNDKGVTIAAHIQSPQQPFTKVWETVDFICFISEQIKQQRLAAYKEGLQKQKAYEADMIKRFGQRRGKMIINNKVEPGMTKEMCQYAWGEPTKTKLQVTSGHTTEQWMYENTLDSVSMLYFENGILTTIQP